MTRRLDRYRSSTAGALLYLVAFAAVSPLLFAAPPARAAFGEVEIVDDAFEPPEITIERGDTVVWVHRGDAPHDVRASDGSFGSSPGCSFQNSGACMRRGARYSRTFDQAGTFTYYCNLHGTPNGLGMAGRVTVRSGSGGGGSTTTSAPPPPTTQTTRPATTTTTRPSTPGGSSTTQPPGPAAPSPGSGSALPSPLDGGTTLLSIPGQDAGNTTTSVVAGIPINEDGDDGDSNLLIGVAAAALLAAAVSATAWYYRPAARRPGGPPPATPV